MAEHLDTLPMRTGASYLIAGLAIALTAGSALWWMSAGPREESAAPALGLQSATTQLGAGATHELVDGASLASPAEVGIATGRVAAAQPGSLAAGSNALDWSGQVVAALDGAAIEGALVRVSLGELFVETLCGVDGHFEMRVPAEGDLTLAVEHPLFVDHREPAAKFEVGRIIALESGGRIRGHVECIGNCEVVGLEVGLWTADRRSLRGEPKRLTTTVEGGKFVFHGLRAGVYAIGGYGENTPLTVLSGLDVNGTSETYATLVVRAGLVLRGAVLMGSERRPVAGAQVRLRPELQGPDRTVENLGGRRSESGPSGRFEIVGLAQGALDIRIGSSWGQVTERRIDLSSFDQYDEREFILPEPSSISGRVLDPSGKPLAGILVGIVMRGDASGSEREHFERALADPSSEEAFGRGVQWSAADGSYSFDPAPSDGTVYVVAFPPEDQSAQVFPAKRTLEDIKPGRKLEGIDLQLQAGRPVSGRVVDGEGQPLAGALVQLDIGYLYRWREFATTTAGADGSFSFPAASCGSARVEARLAGYRSEDKRLDEGQDPIQDLELVLERDMAVRGVVVDKAGLGIPGVYVRLRLNQESRRGRTDRGTDSDEFGRFEITGLRQGDWRLEVFATGWQEDWDESPIIQLPHPEELRIVLDPEPIPETASFAGDLVDGETGGPVARLRIDGMRSATLDVDGLRFVASGLRPGRQELQVEARGYERLTLPIKELHPGQHIELGRMVVWRGRDVYVYVRGPGDKSLKGAEVLLLPLDHIDGGVGEGRSAVSLWEDRRRYRYQKDDVARRRWTLRVRYKGYQEQSRIIDLSESRSFRVDLKPKPRK